MPAVVERAQPLPGTQLHVLRSHLRMATHRAIPVSGRQAVLNLLALAAVLTTRGPSAPAALSGACKAAAASAVSELLLRPRAVSLLSPPAVLSLCIVLQRLQRTPGCRPPNSFLQCIYSRVAALASELPPAELAVCLYCLASFPCAPPPSTLAVLLSALTAAAGALESTDISSTAAALLRLRPLLAGEPAQELQALVAALCDVVAAAPTRVLDVAAWGMLCELGSAFGCALPAAFMQVRVWGESAEGRP
jgi:hypothetical protein